MQIFYLKAESKIETEKTQILLKDAGIILCKDSKLQKRAENMVIHTFKPSEHRVVMNTITIIQMLQREFPECMVLSLGESDIVMEKLTGKVHPFLEKLKIALVCVLCFFGAAFTIMAFHNDISINEIFMRVYELLAGEQSDGFTILEISYSIGLTCGIILFFNHIGARRITKDPTPVEVQMRQYEENVITTLVENADRNQEEL